MKIVLVLSLVFATTLVAQDKTKTKPVGDTRVVDFFLPDKFEDALKAGVDRNRCILIKGVAFGVDEEGATCATKGHW